jgi:phage/plasmid primase-like uncharacterized protein
LRLFVLGLTQLYQFIGNIVRARMCVPHRSAGCAYRRIALIGNTAKIFGLASAFAVSVLVAACDDQNSAEKAGQKAGQKVDQAVESVKENAKSLAGEIEKKTEEAAEAVRQGAQRVLEKAEKQTDRATDAVDESAEDPRAGESATDSNKKPQE